MIQEKSLLFILIFVYTIDSCEPKEERDKSDETDIFRSSP